MAILKVARLGHPVLRARAIPVPPSQICTPSIQRLIDDMFDTMREYAGIGLAAPQVHESVRIFVAGIRRAPVPAVLDEEGDMPLIAIINPELTLVGPSTVDGWEGCLSIPDIRGRVPRAEALRLTGYDREGQRMELAAIGFPARVLQHETDHLDGVLFFDRMTKFETLTFMDEYQRFWAKDEDEDEEAPAAESAAESEERPDRARPRARKAR